jgi:hypothetical protein
MRRPCEACNRLPLPEVSQSPPTPEIATLLAELRRFAREFDSMDEEGYRALDFVDWIALSVTTDPHPDQRETRRAGQYVRWAA